jgi:hypothetical protein
MGAQYPMCGCNHDFARQSDGVYRHKKGTQPEGHVPTINQQRTGLNKA